MIKNIVHKCMAVAILVSVIIGCVLYFGSDFWAENILKQKGAEISIRVLAPSLPFIAVSACIRG